MGNRMVVILLVILICTALAVGQAQTLTDFAQWTGVPASKSKPTTGPATLAFQKADYLTGPVPYAIAAGDFNGDGYLDIVTANIGNIDSGQGNNTIGVLLNNGNGAFAPAVSYTVGNEPNRIVVGDFHGKGKPDIVVVNSADQTVGLLSNKGKGTFGAQKIIEKFYCTGLDVGDFNGDGKLDLACSQSSPTAAVLIMLGNGNGTFQSPVSYALPSGGNNVVVADLRQNGKLDLIVPGAGTANNQIFDDIYILLGNGDGTFKSPVSYVAQANPVSVAVGDFNGDGKLDLAVLNLCGVDPGGCSFSTLVLLLGNGDGTFQPARIPWFDLSTSWKVVAADFSGNGEFDLAVANLSSSTVTVFINTPGTDGAFPARQTWSAGNGPIDLVAGRFGAGGNGSADMVLANWGSYGGNSITVMLNQAATIISLQSTPNPSSAGQAVTFSATVGAAVPGAGTPTGTVTFQSGSKKLGTAKLVNGVAVLTSKKLAAGSNNIVAVYSGDNSFNPDTSTVLVQTIN